MLPEEVGHFDRQYRQAMAAATESLDLTEVLDVLRRWQRIAVLSQDPVAHRAMLDRVARLRAGEDIATEKWTDTKARLGL